MMSGFEPYSKKTRRALFLTGSPSNAKRTGISRSRFSLAVATLASACHTVLPHTSLTSYSLRE